MLRWNSLRRLSGPITSTTNPTVKDVVRLHQPKHRRETGLVLVEGPQLAEEAVRAGLEIEFGFTTDPDAYPDAVEVSPDVLTKASTTSTPNTVVLIAHLPPEPDAVADTLAVLWDVSEPGNVGALIRSAAAFGFDVVVAGSSADPWSPKALRAGAGGHFHTQIRVVPELVLSDLHDAGYETVATVARAGEGLPGIARRLALLIGSEAHGLPTEVSESATHRWTIPTKGVESLNAAVAGSIAMFSLSQTA